MAILSENNFIDKPPLRYRRNVANQNLSYFTVELKDLEGNEYNVAKILVAKELGLSGFIWTLGLPPLRRVELESEIENVKELTSKFVAILKKWRKVKGSEEASLQNLISILRNDDNTYCAEALEDFCNKEGAQMRIGVGRLFDAQTQEFDGTHMAVLVEILERNIKVLNHTSDFVKQFDFPDHEQIFRSVFNRKISFKEKIEEFVEVLKAKIETPITLSFMAEKLQIGLHGAHLELSMYIQRLEEMSRSNSAKSGIDFSSYLKKFRNLRLLDDKGQSIVLEGSFENGETGKLVPYAIKVLPLLNDTTNAKETLDNMILWNNMSPHPNVLKPVRIWSERVAKGNRPEYETLLGITSHNNKLRFREDTQEIQIMCYQLELCRIHLRLFLQFNNTPSSNDRMEVFAQLVDAVQFLHQDKQLGKNGHGNLCPETILLLEQDDGDIVGPKLKISNKSKEKNRYSILYRAIEFEDDESAARQPDKRPNDIFALGVILFELFYPQAQKELTIQLRGMQRGKYPEKFKETWPRVVDIVDQIVTANHNKRVTAEYLHYVLTKTPEFKKKNPKEWDMQSQCKKGNGSDWVGKWEDEMKTSKQDVSKPGLVDSPKVDVNDPPAEEQKEKPDTIKRTLSIWKSSSNKPKKDKTSTQNEGMVQNSKMGTSASEDLQASTTPDVIHEVAATPITTEIVDSNVGKQDQPKEKSESLSFKQIGSKLFKSESKKNKQNQALPSETKVQESLDNANNDQQTSVTSGENHGVAEVEKKSKKKTLFGIKIPLTKQVSVNDAKSVGKGLEESTRIGPETTVTIALNENGDEDDGLKSAATATLAMTEEIAEEAA